MALMCHFWTRQSLVFALGLLFLGVLFFVVFVQPSHDRIWELGQERLPKLLVNGERLQVENFRNFQWTGEFTALPHYETRSYDLATMRGLDVFISHFDDIEGLAHIFLSFGFADEQQLVVTLESRREVDEEFSPILGLLRQYEIIYVVGSEEDIVGVRTVHRGERVYRYETVATPDQAKALLLRLADDINGVVTEPRFYNTLTNNCTNELTRRVEDIAAVDFPLTWKTLLPGYFDEVLYEMNLIEKTGDFATTKAMHLIDSATANPLSGRFSQELRSR